METAATTTLIRVSTAAHLAGVSRAHLYRLIERGEVPAIRVGEHGPIRVDREPFLEWLYGGQPVTSSQKA
jgi:excisionase family DNA binding protein